MVYHIIFLIILNFLLFNKLNLISEKINLYDFPDGKRKNHLQKTPAVGGVLLFINLFYLFLVNNFTQVFNFNYSQLFIFSSLIFLVTIYDDKFNLSANKKFFLLSLIIVLFLYKNQNFLISYIIFDFKVFYFQNDFLKFFFTWLCIMLFINAINLYDGINSQLALYTIFIFIFLLTKSIYPAFLLLVIIPVIFFIIYNFKGKIFFGDNGSFLIAFLISSIIILNNNNETYLDAETIFVLMFWPGFDMFRLFIERLINKKNPFDGDNYHLHHLLAKKFTIKIIFIINLVLYSLPLMLVLNFNKTFVIIALIFFYYLLVYKFLNHKFYRS